MNQKGICRILALTLTTLALAGCAAVTVDAGSTRDAVSGIVKDRGGREPAVHDDPSAADRVRSLLADGLTAEKSAEITLLQNRNLRALYTDLDVAESDLVQASLLHNPVFDAVLGFPVGGGEPVDFTFGVAMDVVDLLYVPLRKRVATARLEEAKLRVAAEVLEFAWRAETAFYRHQADAQMLEMRRQVAQSASASSELTRRMREAGNARELDLSSEQALAEEAKLDLRSAEIAEHQSREQLNELMGLWGEEATTWRVAAPRLPDPPAEALDTTRLESRAIERSLDLAAAERLVAAAGESLGLDRASALFPEVDVGGSGDRDGGTYESGPKLVLPIPLFDRGQARVFRARAELARARELHYALAIRVRAVTRSTRDRLVGERDRAVHYRQVLLPLRDRVVRDTQLQYNAMQLGPLELLRAKELQIETATRYIGALREYWMARADLGLVLAGRLPPGEAAPAPPSLQQLPRLPFPTLQ